MNPKLEGQILEPCYEYRNGKIVICRHLFIREPYLGFNWSDLAIEPSPEHGNLQNGDHVTIELLEFQKYANQIMAKAAMRSHSAFPVVNMPNPEIGVKEAIKNYLTSHFPVKITKNMGKK